LADLDEDGDVDIVAANHNTDHLTILHGDGFGKFKPAPNSPLRIDVSPHPHVVQAADLDADGHVDLVVDNRDAEALLILRGTGDGSFQTPGITVDVGGDPYLSMAIGDIEGDSRLDIVTPNPRNVGVIINRSDEDIAFVKASPVPAQTPFAVGLGDFNGDRSLDLITASDEGSPLVQLFWGDGNGDFEEAQASPLQFAAGGKTIAVGDFNGDGVADAVIASYQSPDVLMILGGQDSIRTGYLRGDEHPWGLAIADFNEDGRDDVVIGDDETQRAIIYLSIIA
jgi:hypothetical protein